MATWQASIDGHDEVTGGVPALLRAWTSSPWSCPDHFSPLSKKEIAEFNDESSNTKNSDLFPQTAPTDESFNISGLKISSVDDLKAGSWKSRYKIKGDRWRPIKSPPMVKLVNLSFQRKREVFIFFCWSVWMNYLFVRECLYSMRGTVTCLVTIPIVEEFERFRDNFHNCHEVTLFGICIPQRLLDLTFNGSTRLTPGGILSHLRLNMFRAQQACPSFMDRRMRLFWTSMILLPFFSLDDLYGRDMTRWIFITPSILIRGF